MPKKYEIHLVSHTHWDREWYLTFEQFRLRLGDLIDHLLEIMDSNPDYKYYMLDGQTVVLEDYLEIRHKNRERLKKYIKEGRIFVGPWYILPDEFLVSGESTIRNLLRGHRIARAFGRVMKSGYIPDPFGHISQMPQILKGFEIDNCILWRGFGGEDSHQNKSEYIWKGPDGTEVLLFHLPKCGYANALYLPTDIEEALKKVESAKAECISRAQTPYLLFLNGVDHVEPQPELPCIIANLNSRLKDARIVHSNMERYVSKVKSAKPKLKIIEGELRNGFKYTILLTGVISTRMYLKLANNTVQTKLEKWAEPVSIFDMMAEGDYHHGALDRAWKYLLQNHPHDSICGCSIDKVHRDMMTRFSWAEEIATDITDKALNSIAHKVDMAGVEDKLVILNTLNWQRSEVVKAEIDFPDEDGIEGFGLYDEKGNEVLYHVSGIESVKRIVLRPELFPLIKPVKRFTINFIANNVPACGYKAYAIRKVKLPPHPSLPDVTSGEEIGGGEMVASDNCIENEFLKVKVNPDGSLNIEDKSSGKTYYNLNYFEDSGDAGDEYNYSYPKVDSLITTLNKPAKIQILTSGTNIASLAITHKMLVPEELKEDRTGRSKKLIPLYVKSVVSLHRGSKRVDISTSVDNNTKDHRLRAVFPSGIKTDYSWADSKFDVVKRPIKPELRTKEHLEEPSKTHPYDSFVDLSDSDKGLAIMSDGLTEFEVQDNPEREIAITLIRCVGDLSREDLITRPGGAGWPQKTPDAQCQGDWTFNYSIYSHTGDWLKSKVYKEVLNYRVALRPVQDFTIEKKDIKKPLPSQANFITLSPDNLVISCLKKAEDDDMLVLRFYNISNRSTKGKVSSFKNIRKAYLLNMNEEIKGVLKVAKNSIHINASPKKVITLGLRF